MRGVFLRGGFTLFSEPRAHVAVQDCLARVLIFQSGVDVNQGVDRIRLSVDVPDFVQPFRRQLQLFHARLHRLIPRLTPAQLFVKSCVDGVDKVLRPRGHVVFASAAEPVEESVRAEGVGVCPVLHLFQRSANT